MPDLKKLFSAYLNFDAGKELLSMFNPALPLPLRQLYEIRAIYKEAYGKQLFDEQDHLFRIEALDLSTSPFTFMMENQGNWICQTELNTDQPQVIYDDRCGERHILDLSLTDFLTTYALQELTFSFDHISYCNWTADAMRQLYSGFQDLWVNKAYIYRDSRYSFYTLDNEVVFMMASGTPFFGTNNLEKFNGIEERSGGNQDGRIITRH